MAKLALSNVNNFQNNSTAIAVTEANNDLIEAAIENTLSRDGSTPNYMDADIDMNSYTFLNVGNIDMNGRRITELPLAQDANDPVILSQLEDVIGLTLDAPFTTAIAFIVDGGAQDIATGLKGDLAIPFQCVINSAQLLSAQTGSIVLDLWKSSYANFPPTILNTITASAKPTLSTAAKSMDTTLTGWTVNINEGDILRYNVDSCAGIQRVTLTLKVTKV